MQDKKNNPAETNSSFNDPEIIKQAHEEADKDISKDPDFKADENADLDEGELARKEGHE